MNENDYNNPTDDKSCSSVTPEDATSEESSSPHSKIYSPYSGDGQTPPDYPHSYDDAFSGNSNMKSSQDAKRSFSDAGCFLTLFFAFIVFAFAVVIIMKYAADKNLGTQRPEGTAIVATDNGEATATPKGTPRPTPNYNDDLPEINDYTNPFPDIIEELSPGVVSVSNYVKEIRGGGHSLSGTGTGFVISEEGYIVTNAHVIEGADKVTIMTSSGSAEVEAEVIGMDTSTDIAVLKIDNSDLELIALPLGDSDDVRVGEFVIAIGDPSGRELAGTITFGIVSATSRTINIDGNVNTYIQTDAAMNPGNSGGPLINSIGQVIGITSAKTLTASYDEFGNPISAEGLGFAYPISDAMDVIEELINAGFIARPGIGVSVYTATEEHLADADLEGGIYVVSVIEDGPADLAGLKEGDIIVTCEGEEMLSTEDLTTVLRGLNVGDIITVKYVRDGEEKVATITIGDLNLME